MTRNCLLAMVPLFGIALGAEPESTDGATPDNVVTRLERALIAGDRELVHERKFGYLRSVLRELRIPESSQTLVFSKTSMQRSRISPRRPRALYFNDDVHVGYCHAGRVLELAVADPRIGTAFYTLDQTKTERPTFVRRTDDCLLCHGSSHTDHLPGHLVRSIFPNQAGLPLAGSTSFSIDHTTPIDRRWGGWYVTGTHGDQKHLGNLVIRDPSIRPDEIDNAGGLNIVDLSDRFTTSAYPTPHSDIVALMVLEHQTTVHNAIVLANLRTRWALSDERATDEDGEVSGIAERRDAILRRIEKAGEKLLRCLLFVDEARVVSPIKGTSGFTTEFSKCGPHDANGRSLRDFDLRTRLFRYRCSYLVQSESFDAIPEEVRSYVLRRLHEVLTGQDDTDTFAHIEPEERRTILGILLETKPTLPRYWRSAN